MTDVKTDVVLYDVRDRIATLTLNRPDRLNAWTGGLARRYYSLLEDAAADPDVRVIVVAGARPGGGGRGPQESPPGRPGVGPPGRAGAPRPPRFPPTSPQPRNPASKAAVPGHALRAG